MRLRRDGSDYTPLAAPVVKDLVDLRPMLAAESFIMLAENNIDPVEQHAQSAIIRTLDPPPNQDLIEKYLFLIA